MLHFSREIRDDDLHVLLVSGEADISNREELRQALAATDAGASRVLIDLCRCRYFDATTLTELVRFYKARRDGQHLALAAAGGFARRILHLTAIDEILPVEECLHAV